jgi:hypothetical protein
MGMSGERDVHVEGSRGPDTANPFVGKWVLDIAESTFDPPQPPKSNTATTTEASGGGLHTNIDFVEADGSNTHMEYTVPSGGPKATPVTGASDCAHTIKYSLSKAGKVVESGTLTVSKSGKNHAEFTFRDLSECSLEGSFCVSPAITSRDSRFG